jgi:hypothetical protein
MNDSFINILEKFMNSNINIHTKNNALTGLGERVEVMALFSYGFNPCEPLRLKRQGRQEEKVTDLLKRQVKFLKEGTVHIFDIMVSGKTARLSFNSETLLWYIS